MANFDLSRFQQQISSQHAALPPVEKWNPDFCGDIDLVVKHDGSWFYMGTPIGRQSLVKLFSTVVKREGDHYFLVTPVEKVGIQVEDAPFIITEWQREKDSYLFTTNVGDTFMVGPDNPIQVMNDQLTSAPLPYALVRRNLWARLHQNVFYQLAELGEAHQVDGKSHLMLNSAGYSFSLGEL